MLLEYNVIDEVLGDGGNFDEAYKVWFMTLGNKQSSKQQMNIT